MNNAIAICKDLQTMSRTNSKKSQLYGEELQKKKSWTVYERLKRAYDISSDKELAKRFGIKTRQGIGERKKSGNWDPQEIIDLFPDVNHDWVFSERLEDLQTLPVRSDPSRSAGESSTAATKGELSVAEIKFRLEQIESIARTLKDNF